MQREPLGLPVLLVPAEIQPAQPLEDGIERGFGVALDVGIVDAQDHGAAVVAGVEPVEDEGARAPDVQKARGRRRKADSQHGNASITSAPFPTLREQFRHTGKFVPGSFRARAENAEPRRVGTRCAVSRAVEVAQTGGPAGFTRTSVRHRRDKRFLNYNPPKMESYSQRSADMGSTRNARRTGM